LTTEHETTIDNLPRSAVVLLARLLFPLKSLTEAAKDVAALTGPQSDERWRSTVAALTHAGLATVPPPAAPAGRPPRAGPVPLYLTGEGRTAARERLGVLADAPRLTPAKVVSHWSFADPRPSPAVVLLTRLYVPDKKPPTDAALRKFVGSVVGAEVDDAAWAAAKATLLAAGYTNDTSPPTAPAPAAKVPRPAKPQPLSLTEAGRSTVLAWLGMDAVPDKLSWKDVRDKWLPAAVVPADQRAVYRDDKRVVPLLLGQALDVGPAESVEAAVAAAVSRDVGYPQCHSLDELVSAVLSKRLGKTVPPLTAKQRATLVPAAVFGLPDARPAAVRAAAVKRWATDGEEAPPPPPPPAAEDLSAFAERVNGAAAASSTGRWGDDKVFISHVHRHLNDGSDLAEFKRRLVEANTAGLIRLARADLVAAMDPADVRESEAAHPLGAEFHFVRIP
jgi:hypothetical protein